MILNYMVRKNVKPVSKWRFIDCNIAKELALICFFLLQCCIFYIDKNNSLHLCRNIELLT